MSADSFLLLRFHTPILFALGLHRESVASPFGNGVSSVTCNVSIECFGADFVFFEVFYVQVQVLFGVNPSGVVKQLRINHIGGVELKIREVINFKFLRSGFLIA